MNTPVPLGICCQAEEILIARVAECTVRFPSLVSTEAPLCKGNLCQRQVGTETENLKNPKNKKKNQVQILLTPMYPFIDVISD